MPEFFIVGHHKSGTTALYEMLRRHPRIYMPDLKAPRFFASDTHPESQRLSTLEEYLALFAAANPDERVGEASMSYLWSSNAAAAIAEVQPAARIIAILREPASFLRSLHLQYVQAHMEPELSFRKALALEPTRRQGTSMDSDGRWIRALWYSDHVHYVDQLRRYHAVFPAEQILVLIYDDFRKDNDATLRRVLRFIDVEDAGPIELLDVNPTVRVRSRRLQEALRSLYLGRGVLAGGAKAAVTTLSSRRVRQNALSITRRKVVYGKPHPPDPELTLELRRAYKREVVALSDYLQRDLVSLWGYDDLD